MGWSAPVLAQYVLTYAAYTMAYCARKPFSVVKSDLKKDGVDILLAETAFLGLYALGMFIFVRPAEQFGVIRSLTLCYFGSAICLFLFGFCEGSNVKVITWGLNGLLQSVTFPLFTKILVPFFSKAARGSSLGIWTTSQQVGAIGATFLATWVCNVFNWQWAFYVPAVLMLVMGVIIFLFVKEEPTAEILAAIKREDEGSFLEDSPVTETVAVPQKDEVEAAKEELALQRPQLSLSTTVKADLEFSPVRLRRRPSVAPVSAPVTVGAIAEGFGVTSRPNVAGAGSTFNSFASAQGSKRYQADGAAALLGNVYDGSMIIADDGAVVGPEETTTGIEAGLLAESSTETEKVSLLAIVSSVPFMAQVSLSLFFVKLVRYIWMYWLPFYLEVVGLSKQTARYTSIVFDVGSIAGSILCGFVSTKLLKNQRALSAIIFALLTGVFCVALTFLDLSSLRPAKFAEGEPSFIDEISSPAAITLICIVFGVGAFIAGPDSLLGSPVPADIAELSPYGAIALGPTAGIVHGVGAVGAMLQAYVVDWLAHPTLKPAEEQTAEDWVLVYQAQTVLCVLGAILLIPTTAFFLRKAKLERDAKLAIQNAMEQQ